MKQSLVQVITKTLEEQGIQGVPVQIDHPSDPRHGDFSTNVALIAAKKLGKSPREIAEEIVKNLKSQISNPKDIQKIEVAGAGFINFYLSPAYLVGELQKIISGEDAVASGSFKGKKIMVEYAHPNTHKEMHIGHMRTLITGEALARIFESLGATVFRANYQGDIGPHVAKAIWGIQKLMDERGLMIDTGSWKLEFEAGGSKIESQASNLQPQDPTSSLKLQASNNIEDWSHIEKAHFLGEGYAKGSQEYDTAKEEIDTLNSTLYKLVNGTKGSQGSGGSKGTPADAKAMAGKHGTNMWKMYQLTRQWSLDYYQDFYERFYTTFDRLFFESQMVQSGKKIVTENIGKVFKEENGAVIFPGEEYARLQSPSRSDGGQGLHTRVFITQAGNPTYEGKEMGNGFAEWQAFPFDMKVHVVGSEQAGYFQVVFKALELLDPEKFKDKQHHVSMGMVTLTDRKMSSRTGDILRVDWLLDEVKKKVDELFSGDRVSVSEKAAIAEVVTIAAVKYSVLKVGATQNVAFSIDKSVTLDGDSGPYLQYTYVRTQSVLSKSQIPSASWRTKSQINTNLKNYKFETEELALLRKLAQFSEIVESAAEKYSPSVLATYLFELAQEFNLFYQKHSILDPVIASETKQSQKEGVATDSMSLRNDNVRDFRIALTAAVGLRIKHGLDLLGITAPERM